MAPKITLVEDDEILRDNFSDLLRSEGFEVQTFADRDSAKEGFLRELPDIALLDISLGQDVEAGFSLCTELRQISESLPIIFFTSHASEMDKISGMRLGADDYLTKDISFEYLIVRIRALLKRVSILSSNQKPSQANTISHGPLSIDLDQLSATWNGIHVELSLTQVYMLIALTQQPGKVLTSRNLMNAANIIVEPNTISAHIKNIRNAFRQIDPEFSSIRTERSVGYRWVKNEKITA